MLAHLISLCDFGPLLSSKLSISININSSLCFGDSVKKWIIDFTFLIILEGIAVKKDYFMAEL